MYVSLIIYSVFIQHLTDGHISQCPQCVPSICVQTEYNPNLVLAITCLPDRAPARRASEPRQTSAARVGPIGLLQRVSNLPFITLFHYVVVHNSHLML
jgi:hypothetical protein